MAAQPSAILKKIEVKGQRTVVTRTIGKTTQMRADPNVSLRDFLNDSPGVNLVTNSEGGIANLNIRGLGGKPDMYGQNSGRIQMTLDGLTLPESFAFSHQAKDHGIGYFDSSTISTVTIDRGPTVSSAVSAMGGVVALRTKEPEDVLLPDRKLGGQLRTGYDGRYRGKFVTGATAIKTDKFSMLLQYTKRRTHEVQFDHLHSQEVIDEEGKWPYFLEDMQESGFDVSEMTQEEIDELYNDIYGDEPKYDTYKTVTKDISDKYVLNTYSFLNKWHWDINERNRLSLTIDRFESMRKEAVKEELKFEQTHEKVWDSRQMKRLTLMLKGEHDEVTPLTDQISWTLASMKTEQVHQNLLNQKTLGTDNYADILAHNMYHTRTKTIQLNAIKWMETGLLKHRWDYGVNYRQSELTNRIAYQNTIYQNREWTKKTGASSYFPDSKRVEQSVFISDRVQYRDGPISMTPSLKYTKLKEHSFVDGDYELREGESHDLYQSNQAKKFYAWDYALAFGWEINTSHYVSLSYSQAHRFPGYAELNPSTYFHWEALPNPNLKPEKSQAVSLGWAWKTAWYQQNIELADTKVIDKLEGKSMNCHAGTCRSRMLVNFTEPVRIRSIEYKGEVDFGGLSDALKYWRLVAAISYSKGKDKAHGLPVNSIAPLNGYASLNFKRGDINAFARVNFSKAKKAKDIGQYDNVIGGTPPPMAGWATLDVGVGYSLGKRLDLNIMLYNVFDKQYQRWENVNAQNASFRDQFWEPGRAWVVNLGVKF
ncbi:TonB-dependent receptor domain-containing protein [Basilea psittacipulmonis]|nr:TonB-dependent receptor [Basilea psittacipulmonis]